MGMCDKIKALPQSRNFYPTLAICSSIAALILTSLSAFACWFVTVDLTASSVAQEDHPLLPPGLEESALRKFQDYSMGMWGRETTSLNAEYCVLYSSNEKSFFFDAYWRASRAFALICSIFSLIAMVATIFHACTREPIVNRNLLPCYCFVALMQALAFLAYGSDICKSLQCQYSSGSTFAIVAIVLYILTGVFHFLIYKQEMFKAGEKEAPAAQDEEEAKEPDGAANNDEPAKEETNVEEP